MKTLTKISAFALASFFLLASCKTGRKTAQIDYKTIDGTWFVTEPNDTEWNSYTTITFDSANKTFGAYNACNHTSGSFEINGNYMKTESDGISTLMYCPCSTFFGFMDGTMKNYTKDGAQYIDIQNGAQELVYRKPGRWMLAGSWIVSNISGKDISDKDIVANIDIKNNIITILDNTETIKTPFKTGNGTEISIQEPNISNHLDITKEIATISQYEPSNGHCAIYLVFKDKNGNRILTLQREMANAE